MSKPFLDYLKQAPLWYFFQVYWLIVLLSKSVILGYHQFCCPGKGGSDHMVQQFSEGGGVISCPILLHQEQLDTGESKHWDTRFHACLWTLRLACMLGWYVATYGKINVLKVEGAHVWKWSLSWSRMPLKQGQHRARGEEVLHRLSLLLFKGELFPKLLTLVYFQLSTRCRGDWLSLGEDTVNHTAWAVLQDAQITVFELALGWAAVALSLWPAVSCWCRRANFSIKEN